MSKIENRLSDAFARVQLLTDSLPTVVDPADISLSAKLPFRVMVFREPLIWRTEELARCACTLFKNDDIVSAIILTRSVTENAVAIWYLMEVLKQTRQASDLETLDEKILRLSFGNKRNDGMPEAINVLTLLGKADKSIPGILSNYNSLSEYAHPNWSGVSYVYSQIDRKKVLVRLGKNARSIDSPALIGLNSLIGSLAMFEHAYNKISDLMPEFVALCESDLAKKKN